MAKAAAAVAVSLIIVWAEGSVRAQALQLIPKPCAMACPDAPPPRWESESDLMAVIATGATVAGLAYVSATAIATTQDRQPSPLVGIPVVGAIVEAARHPYDGEISTMLAASAGLQVFGLVVAFIGAGELAESRRWRFAASACGSGGQASVEWKF